jgi:aminoglycoside phosphotransferase (APT) family kinase protein
VSSDDSTSPPRELQPETIEPRADEQLDRDAVSAYLTGRLEGAGRPLRIRQFGGGHANLTYLLCFGEGEEAIEYVLRRPPVGPVAATSHDMRREYRALSVLYKAFPLAPRAYLYCDDASVIGADFLVMERRRGVVVRGVVPAEYGGGDDPDLNRRLSQVVIDVLSDFHAVDPVPLGLHQLGKPEGFMERQVRGWTQRYERARTGDIPAAEDVAKWLVDALPESPPATLLHNDWRLDNMALDPADPGRCVAVYDWDMCTVGDPFADVGTVFASWANPGEAGFGATPMPTHLPGWSTREEALERYAKRSGRDVSGFDYYLVFGIFKMAVVLQQIYYRYARGQTQDARFAGMAQVAEAMFESAAARRP